MKKLTTIIMAAVLLAAGVPSLGSAGEWKGYSYESDSGSSGRFSGSDGSSYEYRSYTPEGSGRTTWQGKYEAPRMYGDTPGLSDRLNPRVGSREWEGKREAQENLGRVQEHNSIESRIDRHRQYWGE